MHNGFALVEGLEDQLELREIGLEYGFLEVADAAVDEFGGAGGGAGSKVVLLYARHPTHDKEVSRSREVGW